MHRIAAIAVVALALSAGAAFAQRVQVEAHDGVPQVSLEGQYAGCRYTIYRARSAAGPFEAVTSERVLCMGPCFVDDRDAVPGETYWYRFDIEPAQGGPQVHGPHPVTIPAPYAGPFHVNVFPNPARGTSHVEVWMRAAASASPVPVRAEILDVQGRRVRTIHEGVLPPGISGIAWDGRDATGRRVAGTFFLRVRSRLGQALHRVMRVH